MAKPKKQEPVKKEVILEQTLKVEPTPELIITPDSIIMKTEELPKELMILEEPEPTKYTSKIYVVNPFTGDVFQPDTPVNATEDSWLESQVAAGLICQSQVI